jgi:hypothetical protein
MREPQLKPDRVVFFQACAICGKEVSPRHPKVSISARYKNSGGATASAHADCVRPFLSEEVKPLLDPEKLLSANDDSEA